MHSALVGLLAVSVPAVVMAYSAQPPRWPGSVKGNIRVTGEFAPGAPMPLDRDVAACGKEIPDDSLSVNGDRRLQNAVVFLENIGSGKDLPRRQLTLDARNCRLMPRVMSMTLGDELTVGSADSVLHQVKAEVLGTDGKGTRPPMNAALTPAGGRIKIKPTAPGAISLHGVHAHPWMVSNVRVFDHPYHVVTGPDGTFELMGVPAGSYTLHVWHERLGEVTRNVDVVAGYPTRVELELGAPGL